MNRPELKRDVRFLLPVQSDGGYRPPAANVRSRLFFAPSEKVDRVEAQEVMSAVNVI